MVLFYLVDGLGFIDLSQDAGFVSHFIAVNECACTLFALEISMIKEEIEDMTRAHTAKRFAKEY